MPIKPFGESDLFSTIDTLTECVHQMHKFRHHAVTHLGHMGRRDLGWTKSFPGRQTSHVVSCISQPTSRQSSSLCAHVVDKALTLLLVYPICLPVISYTQDYHRL